MKVTNSNDEITSRDYLKKLDSELKNKIAERQAEIDNIKKLYDKKVDQQEQLGEIAYLNKIDQNNTRLVEANKDYEQKLKSYNDNLEKTKLSLAQEEEHYRDSNKQQLTNLKNQNEDVYKSTYSNAARNQDDLEFKSQNELKKLTDHTRSDRIRLEDKSRQELNALAFNYNQKNFISENEFQTKLREDMKTHQDLVNQSKEDFKKNIDLTTEKNKRLENEKIRVQESELTFLDKYHKNLIEQQNADFKTRFEAMNKEHERILSDLKNKLNKDIQKITVANSKVKQNLENKSHDDFYKIEKLNPEISDAGKYLIITLNVPEHEKENVHLIAHNRELKLTLSKKFADIVEDDDGSTNRSSKTQLYSKEFKTADILNGKKITEKYEDGVLTFKIEKA